MRYYLTNNTLLIRGKFHACSTGAGGGIREVTTLLNHSVSPDFSDDPDTTIGSVSSRNGLSPTSVFGLLTAVPIQTLCIVRYDRVTVFLTAGVTHPDPDVMSGDIQREKTIPQVGTINIICSVNMGMTDQALLDAIITVTEAKSLALFKCEYPFAGTVTDAVIIGAEGEGNIRYAGGATPLGRCIHEAVLFGVPKALGQYQLQKTAENAITEPVFFIHSTIGGKQWIEWIKKGCPYYPCHFKGQRCEFCYCPLYPCEDETLGEWSSGSHDRGRVWSCAPCMLNHQPAVVKHLRRNPQASLQEIKSLFAHLNP